MLDIYYIESCLSEIPDTPDESKHLGSIELNQHKLLEPLFKKCEQKNINFPYFEDSLLTLKEVEEMWRIFNENSQLMETSQIGKEAYKQLKEILLFAIHKRVGLVSYCD
jgi:hypothetical protein